MLTEERQSRIMELVTRQGSVKLTDICSYLGISESTARRDLKDLDERRLLIKVHGGALAKEDSIFNIEANMDEKMTMNMEEKTIVARYAASLVGDGDFIFMDAGTTTECMIDFLTPSDAVFVTNGMIHALRLAKRGFKVIMTGGTVKAATEALVGTDCIKTIAKMNFTKCFIGVNGISLSKGLTTPDTTEATIKEIALANSNAAYILTDHTKFDKVTAIRFADLDRAVIITDHLPNQQYRKVANLIMIDEQNH